MALDWVDYRTLGRIEEALSYDRDATAYLCERYRTETDERLRIGYYNLLLLGGCALFGRWIERETDPDALLFWFTEGIARRKNPYRYVQGNLANAIRRVKTEKALIAVSLDEHPLVGGGTGATRSDPILRKKIEQAIRGLGPSQRRCAELLAEGYEAQEIAALMKVTEPYAWLLVHRTRENLKEALIRIGGVSDS